VGNFASILRTATAWLYAGIYWSLFLVFYFLTFQRLGRRYVSRIIRFWGKSTLKILGIELEMVDPYPFENAASRVIICNHQSALDVVWGAVICPPGALAIGKKEVIYIPFINAVWWALKFIRVDRKNTVNAIASLKGVVEEITRNSRSLIIAPEGTRTSDGSILEFKKGAFHIALEGGIPIYPVIVTGAFELLPRTSIFPKPGKIRLHFLPKVDTASLNLSQLDSLKSQVRNQMIQAYKRF
jgi:1-acyl-sn-glycerol-3-phosphate acyltransferase